MRCGTGIIELVPRKKTGGIFTSPTLASASAPDFRLQLALFADRY